MYDIIRHTKNNEGCSYMKKLVNKLLEKYKMLNKWEKKVLIWYVISITLIVIEYLINYRLDSKVFFHPYISIMINIFLIIDVFFIPMIFIVKEIIMETSKSIVKVLWIFLSTIGLGIMAIIVLFVFTIFNKSAINSNTVDIQHKNGKIYIKEVVWLESYNHINVYQVENIIFIRLIGSV